MKKLVLIVFALVVGSSVFAQGERRKHGNSESKNSTYSEKRMTRNDERKENNKGRESNLKNKGNGNFAHHHTKTYGHKKNDVYVVNGRYADSHSRNCNIYVEKQKTIKSMPYHSSRMAVNGVTFYYSSGIFYRPVSGYYQVVDAPVGAVVYGLPNYAERVSVNGMIYYQCENTLFVQVNTRFGTGFRVTGQLAWK